MNQTELLKHRAFYEWFRGNFNTRATYKKGRILTGGNISFSCDDSHGVELHLKPKDHDEWQFFNANTTLPDHYLNLPARLRLKRDRTSLQKRLRFWQAHQAFIVDRTGIQGDIRQLAQLAVIFNYQIPLLS